MDTGDLVQEAAINVFRRLGAIEPSRRRALQSYLEESIRNRIRDEIRRAGRVEVPSPEGLDMPAGNSSPLDAAISQDQRDRYRSAVSRLSEDDQSLIVGRVDLGLTYEQIALATRRPTAEAARIAIRRAMVRLAKEIESA